MYNNKEMSINNSYKLIWDSFKICKEILTNNNNSVLGKIKYNLKIELSLIYSITK